MPSESRFPEHDKLAEISDKSQMFGEFLDWLRWSKKIQFVQEVEMLVTDQVRDSDSESWEWREVLKTETVFCYVKIEDLLAEFFGIDQKKLDQEKQQMLDEIRAANERRQHDAS